SPNGDHRNDYFTIIGLDEYPEHELIVFDRWGNQVYRSGSYKNDWNGTFGNANLPDGTYFYVLKYAGNQKLSGYVQINR
ncbi:MAG TPA: gliding motility-associated C-terminal domain-containing protein, partial [Saprospiraceae bacterium]|nr:gliding motility-associated C-terminal domain-containing protein [Saprospiraceae bacterium]